jgi:hypothetical protein
MRKGDLNLRISALALAYSFFLYSILISNLDFSERGDYDFSFPSSML